MLKNSFRMLVALLFSLGLLVACNQENAQQQVQNEENKSEEAFPVTVTDALGNEITIDKKPERIVSLIPSNTETLFALGLNDEIVGVSNYDNYPEEALEKEKVGDMDLDIEKIISLKPDVVFAHESSSHNAEEGLNQLRDAGIKVVVVHDASSFEEVYRTIDLMATATGTKEKGDEIIETMKAKMKEIEAKAKEIQPEEQVNVWVEVEPAPNLYTTGKNTFMHEMLSIIRANNIAGDQEGWVQFTEEEVVKKNPDVIVITYADYVKNAKEQVLSREAWQDVAAVKNNRVYDVHPDLVSRPGPRLVEGIEELANAIYPEVFAK